MNQRQRRLDRKFKMQLNCENCKRWTHVSYEFWKRTAKDDRGNPKEYIYFCRRPKCVSSRPEGMVAEKFDDKKKNKKNPHKSASYKDKQKDRGPGKSSTSYNSEDIQREYIRE